MEQSIIYPTEITYWIAYDTIPDELVVYGSITPEQVLTTGRDYLWYTIDEIEWKDKLLSDFNVVQFPSDPIPEPTPEPTPESTPEP